MLRIELDGSSAPGALLPDGLLISASDSVVRGLVINNFSGEGVQLSGSNNRLGGNFIGTNANGNVSFEFRPAQAVPTGQTVTATATISGGNTSEFSAPRTAA